jgi:hypothetical protein
VSFALINFEGYILKGSRGLLHKSLSPVTDSYENYRSTDTCLINVTEFNVNELQTISGLFLLDTRMRVK